MTAADRAELRAIAERAAEAAADCQRIAEQMRSAREATERFVSRLAITVRADQTEGGPRCA